MLYSEVWRVHFLVVGHGINFKSLEKVKNREGLAIFEPKFLEIRIYHRCMSTDMKRK